MPTKYENDYAALQEIADEIFDVMFRSPHENPWEGFGPAYKKAAEEYGIALDVDTKHTVALLICNKIEYFKLCYGKNWRDMFLQKKETE